jgi:hypothetical protein
MAQWNRTNLIPNVRIELELDGIWEGEERIQGRTEEFGAEECNFSVRVSYNFFDTRSNAISRFITMLVCYNSLTHPFWADTARLGFLSCFLAGPESSLEHLHQITYHTS